MDSKGNNCRLKKHKRWNFCTNPQESASSNTETISLTVSGPENETDNDNNGGGSSSGGGGGGSSAEILDFGNFSGLKTVKVSNGNYSFTEITVGVNSAVTNARVFVEKKLSVGSSYPNISGTAYQYMVLTSAQISDTVISGAKIKFKVENSWLSKNSFGADRIFLLRYNGNNWVEETTTKLSNDGFYSYYEADPIYLGTFAVAFMPKASLEYLKLASLNPSLSDIQAVISSGLLDATLTDKMGNYLAGIIDIKRTEEASKELVKGLGISRAVDELGNTSKMTVKIKNNKNEPVSFMLVEAVPKSIVHDIYALKNFVPRQYDLIIREDPVIQWSFGEAETSIVAWEIRDLKPGDSAVFSYELDTKIDVIKYPAPIVIKPIMEVSTNAIAAPIEQETGGEVAQKNTKKSKAISMILAVIAVLAVIGVAVSMFIKNKGKKEGDKPSEASPSAGPHVEKISEQGNSEEKKGKTEAEVKADLEHPGGDKDSVENGIHHQRRHK